MDIFANSGIYVLLDLTAPGYTIDGDHPEWNQKLWNRYTQVIDAMQVYNNTLGFIVGDDIFGPPSRSSAFIRAVVRDMKSYIAYKGYRKIPVGYSATDYGDSQGIARYLTCGNQSTAIDFLGIKDRSWCKYDSFESSGYAELTTAYSNYTVPVFLSEYGCDDPGRVEDFSEKASIYSTQMMSVLSGAFFYGYFSTNESSRYVEPWLGARAQLFD